MDADCQEYRELMRAALENERSADDIFGAQLIC